jgi:hypothetical protein
MRELITRHCAGRLGAAGSVSPVEQPARRQCGLAPGSAEAGALPGRRGRRHTLRGLGSGAAFPPLSLHRPGIV